MVTANNHIPVIHTARLVLRPVREDDLEDVLEIFSDPETLRHFAQEPLEDLTQAREFLGEKLEGVNKGLRKYWAICLAENDRMIGHFVLFNLSEVNRRAEVGYILNRRFWRNGYASEVLSRMVDHCFETENLGRLEADVDPENTSSLKLLERHGFQREGYFRKRWYFRERWYDSVMFGLLKPGLK